MFCLHCNTDEHTNCRRLKYPRAPTLLTSTPQHSSISATAPGRALASASLDSTSPGLDNAEIPSYPYSGSSLSTPRVRIPNDNGQGFSLSDVDNYTAMQRPFRSDQINPGKWSNGSSESGQLSMAAPARLSEINSQQLSNQLASSAPFGMSMTAATYNRGSRSAEIQHRYSQGLPVPLSTSSLSANTYNGSGLQVPSKSSMDRKTEGYSLGLDITQSHQEVSHNFNSQSPTKGSSNGPTSPGSMSPYDNNGTEIRRDAPKQNDMLSLLNINGTSDMEDQKYTEPMDWTKYLTDDMIDPSREFPILEFDPEALNLTNYQAEPPKSPQGPSVGVHGFVAGGNPANPVDVKSEQGGPQSVPAVSSMGHRAPSTLSGISPRGIGSRNVNSHGDPQFYYEEPRLNDGSAFIAGAFARQARVPAVAPPADQLGGPCDAFYKNSRTELVDRLCHVDGTETVAIRAPAMAQMPRYQDGVLGGPALFLQRFASYTENLQTWSRLANTCTILMHLALQLNGAVPRYTMEERSICLYVNFRPTDENYAKLEEITKEADRIINNQAVARFREIGGHADAPANPRDEGRIGIDEKISGTPVAQSRRAGRGGSALGQGCAPRSGAITIDHNMNAETPARTTKKKAPAKKRKVGDASGASDIPTPAPRKRALRKAKVTRASSPGIPATDGSNTCPSIVSSPLPVEGAL